MHIVALRYHLVMAFDLAQLRALVAVADTGTFTDAAIELRMSQAAVSRSVKALEHDLGLTLMRRGPRSSVPTRVGQSIVTQARRVLEDADAIIAIAATGKTTIRVGYAWAAIGARTVPLQRQWAAEHPDIHLTLVRCNTHTSGLAEGFCDVAILRVPVNNIDFDSAVVGLERRLVAFAADDSWRRRRSLRMAEITERTVLIDARTGTTQTSLWPAEHQPRTTRQTGDVDEWLDAIAAGDGVGTTAEATAAHYPRPGVVYRPISDGPRIPVALAWHKDDPHPAIPTLVDLCTDLYQNPGQ